MGDDTLQPARDALFFGDKQRAFQLLSGALSANPNDAEAWRLLAQCVDDDSKREYCLRRAAQIEAQSAQVVLTPAQAEQEQGTHHVAAPPLRRPLPAAQKRKQDLTKLWVALGLFAVVSAGLIGVGVLFFVMSEGPTSLPAEASATLLPTLAAPTATRTRAPTINAAAACQPLAVSYYNQFRPLFLEFGDEMEVANASPRIALATPIGELQRIQREAAVIEWPVCVENARSLLIRGMDNAIAAYIDFMADAGGTIVQSKMSQGLLDMINGFDQLKALAEGRRTPVPQKLPTNTSVPTPFPTPTALPAGNAIIVTDIDGVKWQVRVERVETDQSFSFDGKTEKASGKFALMFIEVTNRDLSNDAFFPSSAIILRDASGRGYEVHDMAELYAQFEYDMESSCFRINPDQTAHCLTVFDVPQGGVYFLSSGPFSDDPYYSHRVEVNVP